MEKLVLALSCLNGNHISCEIFWSRLPFFLSEITIKYAFISSLEAVQTLFLITYEKK